jgi:hypothetical protein
MSTFGFGAGTIARAMNQSLYKPFFVLVILALSASTIVARPNGISLISSSESELTFTISIKPDLSDLQTIHRTDSSVLPVKTVTIGIPHGARARLVRVQGGDPMAVPAEQLDGPVASNQALAVISDPQMVRGRRIARVYLYPVQGTTVLTSVTVQVKFDGGSSTGLSVPQRDPLFDQIFENVVVNFDTWSQWPVVDKSVAKIAQPQDDPFSHSSEWVKIKVTQTGLVRLSGADLANAGISLTGLASSSIRIFNAGGKPINMQNGAPRPNFAEIALIVNDGGDNQFGSSDQIIWYGEAPSRFVYDPSTAPYYLNNGYTTENVYWLTTSGDFTAPAARMSTVAADPVNTADTTMTTFTRRVHAEQDNLLLNDDGHINDYYTWYWSDATSLSLFVPTPGAVAGQTAQVILNGRTGVGSLPNRYIQMTVNGVAATGGTLSPTRCTYPTTALTDGLNSISLSLAPISTVTSPYFNYLEAVYTSNLVPSGDKLEITVDTSSKRALIQVQDNFSAPMPLLLDIADPSQPVILSGATRSSGLVSFETQLETATANHFYCAELATASAPSSIAKVTVASLRGNLNQADLVIVAPASLMPAMAPYIQFRQSTGIAVRTATVESIMDVFGVGMYDPTAIRDYLKYAYENWNSPAPSAVLFVGDANYDILNHLGSGVPNYVPSYINPLEGSFFGASYSDDNYVYFGDYGILDKDTSFVTGDRGYDMMTARWPVRTSSEIATIVNKIKIHEASNDFGLWRTTVTLVADDEYGQYTNETFHTTQTEELEKKHLPRYFTRDKIYLWEYPFVNSQKPAVNEAIVHSFNRGALVVNYVGHGNPDVWAHERVFTRTGDLVRLQDNDRLPLVFAASCAIGFFDDPLRPSMGEGFLTLPTGGAIGVISAMRLVFSSDNALFNRAVYDLLMYDDRLTVDQAMYAAKLARQYGGDSIPQRQDNDRSYIYFGDPFLKLGLPKLRLQFDTKPDSLTALVKTRVSGRVVDQSGTPITESGKLAIMVFDSDRSKTHSVVNSGGQVTQQVSYTTAGPSIFQGDATVQAGAFQFDFIPPVDLGFGGKGARILAYLILDTVDGVGLVDSIPVSGQVPAQNDTAGPLIQFTFNDRQNFVSGDAASLGDNLQVILSDSSGINLAGGLGHGITLEIDGRPDKSISLAGLFAYDQDSYTTGRISYPLTGLDPGEHSFQLRAWDNANNPTTVDFTANLVSSGAIAINDLLNYPNPMQDLTTFYFELTQPVSRLAVDIFTLSGRKIRTYIGSDLTADNYPNAHFGITWDGKDGSGDRVATGVYIYKATATPRNGGQSVESFGKVVVIN